MSFNLSDKKHYIFDLDGTLIDSNSLHEKAFKKALVDEKVDFSYQNYFGVKTLDVFLSLGFDYEKAKKLTSRKQVTYREYIYSGDVREFPCVTAMLTALLSRGMKVYLCTGASRKSVDKIIEHMGWNNIFEDTICGDEVSTSKPDPMILNTLISRNNILKGEVLYVEDSDKGLATGLNSNVDTVLVNSELPGASFCFTDFSEFFNFYQEYINIKGVA